MIKLEKSHPEFLEHVARFNKIFITDNYGFFFEDNEEFPTFPELPSDVDETKEIQFFFEEVEGKLAITYELVNKSPEQIKEEFNQMAEAKEQELEVSEIKELLKDIVKAKPEAEQVNFSSVFPEYRVGKAYMINEQFRYNKELYKVIQAHTSQAVWRPDVLPALYKKVGEPDEIQDFKQPTGAHDTYSIGDKVRFEGKNYESLIDNNSWSPTAYPQGWKLVQ